MKSEILHAIKQYKTTCPLYTCQLHNAWGFVLSLALYFQRLKMCPISSLEGGWVEAVRRRGDECGERMLSSWWRLGAGYLAGKVTAIQALNI